MDASSDTFARAFGDALRRFLDENGIKAVQAASRLGMNKQTLTSYWTDNAKGKRNKARAELLFLACVELGFVFEFNGRRVAAAPLRSKEKSQRAKGNQRGLQFARNFELANRQGTVSVRVKRPPGRIDLSVSVEAAS